MKTINIERIVFENAIEKEAAKNYPNSGIFESEVKEGFCDLVFVDKGQKHVAYICPFEFFNKFFESQEKPTTLEGLNQNTELIQESIKYEGDFILEFARILLNRK